MATWVRTGFTGGALDLVFWVRIRLGGPEYLGVLDTGATIFIVAKKILPCGSLKNTMTTAAIRMGDGHMVAESLCHCSSQNIPGAT